MGGRDGGEQKISSYLVQLRAESQKKNDFPFKVDTSWHLKMGQNIPEIFTLWQFDYSSVCCARGLNGWRCISLNMCTETSKTTCTASCIASSAHTCVYTASRAHPVYVFTSWILAVLSWRELQATWQQNMDHTDLLWGHFVICQKAAVGLVSTEWPASSLPPRLFLTIWNMSPVYMSAFGCKVPEGPWAYLSIFTVPETRERVPTHHFFPQSP